MTRPQIVILMAIAVASPAASAAPAPSVSPRPSHAVRTAGEAERDVLRALNHGWGRRRIGALYNRRTRLVRNNTQAVCRRKRAWGRGSFLCLVRPATHRRHQGLYIRYRALAGRRFALRWLYYRPGR